MSFNLKNEKHHLKNNKKWPCKLISLNLKNEKSSDEETTTIIVALLLVEKK